MVDRDDQSDEPLPFMQRVLDNPFLLLFLGIAVPAVLYLINHGENFGVRRGRVSFKTRFVARHAIRDRDAYGEINRKFYG